MHGQALEAFRRGEEDESLSVKKSEIRWGVGIFIPLSEGIRNMKEYESASFYGCYTTLRPWFEIRSEIGRLWAVKSPRGKVGPHGVFCDRKLMGRVRKR